MQKEKKFFSVQMITEAGITIALAYVLNLFKVIQMPQGGDVSLSMLPIMIFAIRWGGVKGAIVGALYGILKLIIKPDIVHPIQVLLDYPLPSAFVGIAGISLLKDKTELKGYLPMIILGYVLKFISHVISGVVFFAEYAGDQNPLIYSLTYNITYTLPELIIFIIVIAILWNPLKRLIKTQY